MTTYGITFAIMDMASAKSDVNCPKKKNVWAYCNEKVAKKNKKNKNKKLIDPNCFEFQ